MSLDSTPIRVAVYLRMSTDKQEDSPERQRSLIDPYAQKRGYELVGEYLDEGIAGDVFGKRSGLQRLLADAKSGRFDVVLVDEWSRLSRQSLVVFCATIADPLMQARVQVETVADSRRYDWSNDMDAILFAVHSGKASGESRSLARRVLSEMSKLADVGRLLGGMDPYGYVTIRERQTVPGKGEKMVPVRRELVPHQAQVVRFIYDRYLEGWNLERIAKTLNERGVSPPGKKNRRTKGELRWSKYSVRFILRNIVYTGARAWGVRTQAKYARREEGQIVNITETGKRYQRRKDRTTWQVVYGKDPAIVTKEEWEEVQDRLDKRATEGPKNRYRYALSGLLTCGHCKRTLGAMRRRVKDGDRIVYLCRAKDHDGTLICGYQRVEEDFILPELVAALRREFLNPERLAEIREEIRRQEEAERAPDHREAMQKKMAEMDAKIEKWTRKILEEEDRDIAQSMRKALQELQAERKVVEESHRDAVEGQKTRSLDKVIADCEALLWRLEEALQKADPDLLRILLSSCIDRVVLRWVPGEPGAKVKHQIASAEVRLLEDTGNNGSPFTSYQ